jgi:hypothetical protein
MKAAISSSGRAEQQYAMPWQPVCLGQSNAPKDRNLPLIEDVVDAHDAQSLSSLVSALASKTSLNAHNLFNSMHLACSPTPTTLSSSLLCSCRLMHRRRAEPHCKYHCVDSCCCDDEYYYWSCPRQ